MAKDWIHKKTILTDRATVCKGLYDSVNEVAAEIRKKNWMKYFKVIAREVRKR